MLLRCWLLLCRALLLSCTLLACGIWLSCLLPLLPSWRGIKAAEGQRQGNGVARRGQHPLAVLLRKFLQLLLRIAVERFALCKD